MTTSLPLFYLPSIGLLALLWLLMPRVGPGPDFRGGVRLLWWVNKLYCVVWHGLRVRHLAPLPARGPALLVANHTCAIDHMILQAGCPRILGFLIAQEMYNFWAFRPFCRLVRCIPVRRDGRDVAATRAALKALEQGRVVPIFPEGRILAASGRELGEAKPGAAFIALRAGVPIIPAYIRGTPEAVSFFKALIRPSAPASRSARRSTSRTSPATAGLTRPPWPRRPNA